MSDPVKTDIPIKKSLEIIGKQVAAPIVAAITVLAGLHPEWAILFSFAAPVMNVWGDFGQERINEQLEFISKHKEEFRKEIIEGDDFKTLFLNVLERHMKEASAEKRKLLRNYLLNVGRGVNPGFNEYTRMNNILDTITLYEIDVLCLWDEGGPIARWEKNSQRPQAIIQRGTTTISMLQTYIREMTPRDERLMKMIADENNSKNNQTLLLLGYKGLLYVLAENNFGSGQEARVQDITDFGKAFLAFIKE
jgi:hypothetical protein